jgi:hypothetical protein
MVHEDDTRLDKEDLLESSTESNVFEVLKKGDEHVTVYSIGG